ncbi:MAG: DUF3450 domain-containing protein [Opitutales bacterium]|nr:DUF3450 domain-containing protein [Opitutales bacterium]
MTTERVQRMNKSIILAGVFAAIAAVPVSAQTVIDDTRSALSELVQTKKDIAESKSAWESDKQILQATITSLQDELTLLEERIEAAEKERAESDDVRSQLNIRKDELKTQLDSFSGVATSFEQKVRDLIPYLPEPLQRATEKLSDKLPVDGKTALDAPRRFLLVLGILQEVDKFQTSVQTHKQLLSIDGAEPKEYSVLYYGLAKAFFVDESLTSAGYGVPSAEGWVWTSENGLAIEIDDAVQIAERKKLAEFIYLPISVNQ